jgi:hypothetical protein
VGAVEEFERESLDSLQTASAVAVFRAADGSLVAEVNPPIGVAELRRLVTTARSEGIRVIGFAALCFPERPSASNNVAAMHAFKPSTL